MGEPNWEAGALPMLAAPLPAHSSLGASGAERWLECVGSVNLIKSLDLPPTDEADYQILGQDAHEACEMALLGDLDGWEMIGDTMGHGSVVDGNMAEAVQVYLDECRPIMRVASVFGVEEKIYRPELHPDYFGTIDFWAITEDLLNITDYKHGEGIAVDVEDNPQLMYYAYGKMQEFPEIRRVRLKIVQPRGFHQDGPVREVIMQADDIAEWAEKTLLPGMYAAAMGGDLQAGPHCRFCPAKLACPLMDSLFGAAMKADPARAVNMSDEALGRSYGYTQAVKFYLKALEEETFRRLNLGRKLAGAKLVAKKANRVYKSGATDVLLARLGDAVYTKREFLSPAAVERLSGEAKALISEWAYTPQTGLTVALEADPRPAIHVQTAEQTFGEAAAALAAE